MALYTARIVDQVFQLSHRNDIAPAYLRLSPLKGLMQPVSAFNVPLAAGQPALRVIEEGPK